MHQINEFRLGDYRGVILMFLTALILAEVVISWRLKLNNYSLKETVANLAILFGHSFSKFLFAGYQLWVLDFFKEFAVFEIPSTALTFTMCFLLVDFLFYGYHLLSHKMKFLWAFHLVHHSSPWMNLTTAYRLNWLGGLIVPIFFLPAIVLGFSPSEVVLCTALNLVYQFFLHTELVPKLGFMEKWFNTPSNHRVHHASNPIYIDKNFGGVLIIWDRLFGTYQDEQERTVYGITTGFVGHNPIKLVFHGFVDLIRGKMKSKG
jgi:sterol desaturase/sphingolipid hydroxylase (fatty acid hydroxylase superfamily)